MIQDIALLAPSVLIRAGSDPALLRASLHQLAAQTTDLGVRKPFCITIMFNAMLYVVEAFLRAEAFLPHDNV